MNMKERWAIWSDLGKIRITVAVTLSTLTGYLLHSESFTWHSILPVLGVFLIAASSAALNQYQERNHDAKMERTQNRPLPAGKISKQYAINYVLITGIVGSVILYISSNWTSLFLAWLTLFWYNGVYTPMKRVSIFAVIVGSVIGALPPMIGYTSAGGSWFASDILLVAFFFFIWQVPHFILLVLKLGEQYRMAGYPVITDYIEEQQAKRIIFTWMTGTVFSAFLLVIFQVIHHPLLIGLLSLFSLSLLVASRTLIQEQVQKFRFRAVFMNINLFLLGIMMLLMAQSLVSA